MGFKFKVGREAQGAFKLYKLTINLFAWINWLFVFYIISFKWKRLPFKTLVSDSLQVSLSLNIRKGSHSILEMLQYAGLEKPARRVTNSSSFHAAFRSLSFADCIETRIQNLMQKWAIEYFLLIRQQSMIRIHMQIHVI